MGETVMMSAGPNKSANRNCLGQGDYVVAEGDCLNSIAYQHGLFWKTLWDLPENHDLKQGRKDPDTLSPGDKVTIPELRMKEEDCATEKKHRFKRRGIPAKLRLGFQIEGKPRAHERFILEVDGSKIAESELSSSGSLEESIPPDAQMAVVWVGKGEDTTVHRFLLGAMPPVDDEAGLVRRLQNLGYAVFENDPEGLHDILLSFQKEQGIETTGEPDQATQDALTKKHGG